MNNQVMASYRKVENCRACGKLSLQEILNLGYQALSGVFPPASQSDPISGPLIIGICTGCSLVQLLHSYPSDLMYGENYGYRSGLNVSMVKHLQRKARRLFVENELSHESVILDIGSNDGTLLNALVETRATLIGMDPTSRKFAEFYAPEVEE